MNHTIVFIDRIENSYSPYNGIATSRRVRISGGVITAATNINVIRVCLRYFDIIEAFKIPILARINVITGSWKTIPKRIVRDTKVEI